jgi:hypothetical protein
MAIMALILAVFTAPVIWHAVTDGAADIPSVLFVAVMWWAFWVIATLTARQTGDCADRPLPPKRPAPRRVIPMWRAPDYAPRQPDLRLR